MTESVAEIKVNYVVDDEGRRTAAQISIDEFEGLIDYIEDLEDMLSLEELRHRKAEFRPYSEIREELKQAGLL
jgi:hypothetical protein